MRRHRAEGQRRSGDEARVGRPADVPHAGATKFGMKTFDVYAHHPYADIGAASRRRTCRRASTKRRVQLGNIGLLTKLVTKLYGPKHLWITEYGYQTNPPETRRFGIAWAKQALYMKQAYAIARKNPRIDMMLWFLVRDEPEPRRLAVRPQDGHRQEEAGLEGVPRRCRAAEPIAAVARACAPQCACARRAAICTGRSMSSTSRRPRSASSTRARPSAPISRPPLGVARELGEAVARARRRRRARRGTRRRRRG